MNILIVFFMIIFVSPSAFGLSIDENWLNDHGSLTSHKPASENALRDAITETKRIIELTKVAMDDLMAQLEQSDLEKGLAAVLSRQLNDTYETAFRSYEFLGNRLYEMGEAQEALGAYHRALDFSRLGGCSIPARFHHNLAVAYSHLELVDDAIAQYRSSVSTAGNQCLSASYLGLAKCHERRKDPKSATQALKYGIRHVETDAEKAFLWYEKAMLYNRLDETDKEISALSAALEKANQDHSLYGACLYALGCAYLDEDEDKKASSFFQRALDTNQLDESDTAVAQYELGTIKYRLHDFWAAKALLDRAVKEPDLEEEKYVKALQLLDEINKKIGKKKPQNGKSVVNGVPEQTKIDIRKRAMSYMSFRVDKQNMTAKEIAEQLQPEFPQVSEKAIESIISPFVASAKKGKRRK